MSPELQHLAGAALATTIAWGAAGVLARRSRFFQAELEAESVSGRQVGLDGLRGFLAFAVFLHHGALARAWWETGTWGGTECRVLLRIGPAAVLVFFMITGWLFWGKARRGRGRVPLVPLVRGRLARLAPAYLLAAGLIVLAAAGILLGKPVSLWAADLGRLATLGLRRWSGIAHQPAYLLNAGVNWTLWYEWRFYAVLPLLAWSAVGHRVWVPVIVLVGLVVPWGLGWSEYWLAFLPGVLAAHYWEDPRFRRVREDPRFPWLAVAWFGIASLLPMVRGYTWTRIVALAPLFVAVLAGHRFGGVLEWRASRLLGLCSYSFYLLHGIVLLAALRVLSHWHSPAVVSLPVLWILHAGVGVVAVLVAAASYRWVERPWMRRPAPR